MTNSEAPLQRTTAPRGSGTRRGAQVLPQMLIAVLIASATLGVIFGPVRTFLLGSSVDVASGLLRTLSIAHLAMGLAAFRRFGGRMITPAGVYFLSNALFLGYGGLAPASSKTSEQYLAYASLTLLAFNLVVLGVAVRWLGSSGVRWTTPAIGPEIGPGASSSDNRLRLAPYLALWIVLTLGSGVVRTVPIIGTYADLIQVGISLLLLQAFLGSQRGAGSLRLLFGVPVFLALTLGSYFVTFYSGYGRIILGGFIFAAAALVNRRYPRLPLKMILLIGLVPGLILAGSGERTGLTFREVAAGIGDARGIDSATGAIPVFGLALEQYDTAGLDAYAHRSGRTFLVSAVHWVPRELWPGKPDSVEIELAQFLYPEVAYGYSIVGSNALEWLLNFDLIGLIPGALLTGILLASLDRWVSRRPQRHRTLPHDDVMRALVTGNIAIYAWAGSFSFSARTFTPLMVILALRTIARANIRPSRTRPLRNRA